MRNFFGFVCSLVLGASAFGAGLEGVFNGVVRGSEEGGVAKGFVVVRSTATGGFSGSLQVGGSKTEFAGGWDALGRATVRVPRAGAEPLVLSLGCVGSGWGEVSGKVDLAGGSAVFRALRGGALSGGGAHPLSGRKYSVDVSKLGAPRSVGGSLTIEVGAEGKASVSGVLSSGQRVAASAWLVDDGSGMWAVPVYLDAVGGLSGMVRIAGAEAVDATVDGASKVGAGVPGGSEDADTGLSGVGASAEGVVAVEVSRGIRGALAPAAPAIGKMVSVTGGVFPSGGVLAGEKVPTFSIGATEVTWGEWRTVQTWAISKGYDLYGVGSGSSGDHPVREVSWFDVLKWCNARSEKEGLVPVYEVDGAVYRSGEISGKLAMRDGGVGGYRLPSRSEWVWAARGGLKSKGSLFSGGQKALDVGWFRENSGGALVDQMEGRGTSSAGAKPANELGLYDLSGNVWEWCGAFTEGLNRVILGGGWNTVSASNPSATIEGVAAKLAGERADTVGFRLAYRKTISSVARLAGLTVSGASLSPAFSSEVTRYGLAVQSDVAAIRLVATKEASASGMTVRVDQGNPVRLTSGSPSSDLPMKVGKNTVEIVVFAEDGVTTRSYVVEVVRLEKPMSSEARLSRLSVSSGALSPAFSSGTLRYSVAVGNPVSAVRFTPTVLGVGARVAIRVDGGSYDDAVSGVASREILLKVGQTVVEVRAVAEDGVTTRVYVIEITRAAEGGQPISPPVLSVQPQGGVFSDGAPALLSVVASGAGPFTYQWRRDGVVVAGATGATYAAKEAGSYTVVVSNAGGAVTSSVAVVASAPVDLNAGMVFVKGGVLPASSELKGQAVGDFWIGKYEVTWAEWKAVRDWAAGKGYDLAGVGRAGGDTHPVGAVSWYDALKWSNALSQKEGLDPVYRVGEGVYRSGESVPELDLGANGYRLPVEKEWEWAARGGVASKGYVYSGSNNLNEVGWYWDNSTGATVDVTKGRGSWPVGKKRGNELGLFDMSGNVWEWCWERFKENGEWHQRLRGGSFHYIEKPYFQVANRNMSYVSTDRFPGNGFRLVRNRLDSISVPTIGVQPVGGTLGTGGSVALSVVASGTGPFTYQWRRDGVAVAGATGATYAAKVEGVYTVVISNAVGSVTSAGAAVNGGMVRVEGGTLPASSALKGQVVKDFWVGRYEVTWGEWKAVRDWAVGRGYDLAQAATGRGTADDHPVQCLTWYEALKWCNARSEMDGLRPVYSVDGAVYRKGAFGQHGTERVKPDDSADGYRLPLEKEWEWAARGGASSKGYLYSGSDNVNEVGWFLDNSTGAALNLFPNYPKLTGRGTWPVGSKKGNELGIFDMTGNVFEWCWDSFTDWRRRVRGGSFVSSSSGSTLSGRRPNDPALRYKDCGFRVVRSVSQIVAPSIGVQPVGGTLGAGGSVTLSVVAAGTGPFTYQWKKDGVALAGATGATYAASLEGIYSVVVSNEGGSVTSASTLVEGGMVRVEGGNDAAVLAIKRAGGEGFLDGQVRGDLGGVESSAGLGGREGI